MGRQTQPRRYKMEIILLERIEKLGQMGDTVRVKDGYARNFLLPQKKALLATSENKTRFETEKEALQRINDDKRGIAESAAKLLNGKDFILIRQAGDTMQLFGSVTARDISTSISETGVSVKRQQIKLDIPIKTLGLHNVSIVLHPEVIISVKINVARSKEEAEIQIKGGTVTSELENEKQNNIVDKEIFDNEQIAADAEEKLSDNQNLDQNENKINVNGAQEESISETDGAPSQTHDPK